MLEGADNIGPLLPQKGFTNNDQKIRPVGSRRRTKIRIN
jgi:hypothetical protein